MGLDLALLSTINRRRLILISMAMVNIGRATFSGAANRKLTICYAHIYPKFIFVLVLFSQLIHPFGEHDVLSRVWLPDVRLSRVPHGDAQRETAINNADLC